MKKWLHISLKILMAIGILIVLLSGIFIFLFKQTDVIQSAVESELNKALGKSGIVHYGALEGSLLNSILIKDFAFENKEGLKATAPLIEVHYSIWPLIFNRVHISSLFIDRLALRLPRSEAQPKRALPRSKENAAVNFDSLMARLQHTTFIDSLLNSLPNLDIRDVEISARRIDMVNPQLSIREVQLKIESLKTSRKKYNLQFKNLQAEIPQKDFHLKKLSFWLQGDRKKITLNQFILETDRSKILMSAYYRFKGTFDVNINGYDFRINLRDLSPWISEPDELKGFVQGTMTLSGAPTQFSLRSLLEGRVNGREVDSLDLDLAYDHGFYQIRKARLRSPGGRINLSARGYALKGSRGKLSVTGLRTRYWLPDEVRACLNGELNFDVKNLNLARATGQGRLMLVHSSLDSIPIDTLRFALLARDGNFEIIRPSFLQLKKSCRFDLQGTVSHDRKLDLLLTTFDNNLSNFREITKTDSLTAPFEGQFHATGQLKDPNLSGDLWLPKLSFQGLTLDSVRMRMYAGHIFSDRERNGDGYFKIRSGRFADMPLHDIELSATIRGNRFEVTDMHLYSTENYVKAALIVQKDRNQTKITFPRFHIEYQKYWLENQDSLQFVLDSSGVNIDAFSLKAPADGQIDLSGQWENTTQDVHLFMQFHNIQVEPFEQFWKKRFKLTGLVNGTLEVLNPLHRPEVETDLQADGLIYNGVQLGDITTRFQYVNRLFALKEFNLQEDSTTLDLGGDLMIPLGAGSNVEPDVLGDTEANLQARWSHFRLEHFSPVIKGLRGMTGETSGSLTISGTGGNPHMVTKIELNKFNYRKFDVDSLRLFSRYANDSIWIDTLSAVVNQTHFIANGWQKFHFDLIRPDTLIENQPFHMEVQSKDDHLSFIGLLNEQIERIEGPFETRLVIGGSLNRPALISGFFNLNRGRIILSRVRDPLQNVSIVASVQDSVLNLTKFEAHSRKEKDWLEKSWSFLRSLIPWNRTQAEGGYLGVEGRIGLEDVNRPALNLKVKMSKLYVDYFVENLAAVLSTSDLSIQGRDTLFINGDITIPQGIYEVDLSQLKKNAYLTGSTVGQSKPFIGAFLDVHIPGNFVITSSPLDLANNFKITMMGDLQAIIEPGSPEVQLSGHLQAISGKYSSWNQNFEVQSGTIDFKNPKEINPDINFSAVKVIGNRKFELSINGNLKNINQDIQVTENDQPLEMSYLDKIAMLTLGADVSQISSSADSILRSVGEEVATTSVLTAVERGAEKYTGLDKVEINSNRSLFDLEKMRLNNGLQDASISFGKYLTSDLYVEYRTKFGGEFPAPRLSWDAGNRLELQYRISRRWKLDSFYEKTDLGNTKIQIGLNWEYTF